MKKLQVQLRYKFGRQATSKFRALKQIPAVIYGKKIINNIHVLIEESLLVNIISYPPKTKILISLFKQQEEMRMIVIIQDIQLHPYKNKVLHMDFLQQ